MVKASLVAIVALAAIAVTRPHEPNVIVVRPDAQPQRARVVRVDASEIFYRGVFVETVEAATCPDSPCFYLDGLATAIDRDPDRGKTIHVDFVAYPPPIVVTRILTTIRRAGDDALITEVPTI
ncbi:MAG TPA: hypothetical protein VH143_05195 [Kofleriaceae bacterium]|nr:hypothetical protein [Kofleriaceae bacterium]